MLPLIIPIGSLLLGVSLLLFGSGLLNTLLALRGGLEGYSDSLIGYISSGYFAGFFVGFYIGLPILRRIGHIRAFALCAAIAAAVVLLHSLLVNPIAWILLRVVTGAVLVILYTIIESWLNNQTPQQQRGQVFAIYMAVNLVSLALAQQLLQLDSPANFTLFALAAILVCISLVPITWTRLAQPSVSEVKRFSPKRLVKLAPVAVVGGVFSGLAMGAFWGLMPVFGQRIGFDSSQVAMLMSATIIGGAIFQYPLGRYSDHHDRRQVLAITASAGVIAALLLFLLPASYWLVLSLMALWGGAAFAVYPVSVAHLVDHLEPGDILPAGSALLLIHGMGAAAGPAVAGTLMEYYSPLALLLFFVLAHMMIAAYAFYSLKRPQTKADDIESAAPFVPMVRTTPTALEMLPEDDIDDSEPTADTSAVDNTEEPGSSTKPDEPPLTQPPTS
ncbi:MFS transporter [Oceanobacter sp. 3_MG-2023]|uniref:MFS transporter n=1 Tax=Oceanobacter sp. 3_MG-2023 TaxID=3062622 RepID=UPI0027376648|nr:MFS transporter [Oceanobacter sp. 3_MG-2023]MDP2505977.1 MFS transporter [Oceanobacter sp. 3_MG-2023]